MVFNTQQLQYLIEIERTRSISQAASNLYMGQPNLSRVLRDTENALGFALFDRTRRGVRPTEKGALFLQHARNLLREAEFMERLGPNGTLSNRLRLCLPRSYTCLDSVRRFLEQVGSPHDLDAVIRECHPRQALELVDSGSVEIAVIRYCTDYQDYFMKQADARELVLKPLSQVEYRIVLSALSPLARNASVSRAELESCTELQHRDTFYPANKIDEKHGRIYTVDRMAQLQLLSSMPNAFLWAEPLPDGLLSACHLVQLPCAEGRTVYQDALIYKPQCAMSELEKSFLRWMLHLKETENGSL